MKKNNKCSICGNKYSGFGNNAEPLTSGRCCNECNELVIMKRIEKAMLRSMFPGLAE